MALFISIHWQPFDSNLAQTINDVVLRDASAAAGVMDGHLVARVANGGAYDSVVTHLEALRLSPEGSALLFAAYLINGLRDHHLAISRDNGPIEAILGDS